MAYAADRCGGCYVCGVALSGVEWGAEIPVNGVRPVWLEQPCNRIAYQRDPRGGWYGPDEDWPDMWSENDIVGNGPGWANVTAIRLPASHFAYTAIAKGFEPWGGGDEAPADWDGKRVLARDGGDMEANVGSRWYHKGSGGDVIGYRKRKQPEEAFIPNGKIEASHVSVKRMTQVNADELFGAYSYSWHWAKDNGLIRPETNAERIATKTGLTVAQVEDVLAADKENK